MIKFGVSNIVKDAESMFEIRVCGHACYAEKGKDIVCASASAYCYFLLESLMGFRTDMHDCKVNDGYFKLRVKINNKVRTVIGAFLNCMRDLERQFPKNVMEIDCFD